MRNLINITLILIIWCGCESVLEENPSSNISLANFYQTESDALAGLFGAYANLYSFYGNTAITYGELNADDLTISPVVSDRFEWDEFTYSNDITNGIWANGFQGINRANEVIQYTDGIDLAPEKKADIIAEARALRAIYYFNLVRAMGGVPVYTSPTVGFDELNKPRASESEVYNFIIEDLELAADELNESGSSGRINSNVALALLARIYLYTGDYENAFRNAEQVINSGKYGLFGDYADVFKTENENGVEHIFQLEYLSGERNSGIPGQFGPRPPAGPYGSSFWAGTIVPGSVAPEISFVNENPKSYRKDVTVSDSYEHIDGVTGTITMDEVYEGQFPFYISKFDDRENELQSGQNYNIIRYADILLIAAEALNEIDPSDNQKYLWINTVRERARNGVESDLPDLQGLTQDEFRAAVLEERRFELAFEGQRAWDLKRRGVFLEKLREQGKEALQDFMVLFPIPDNQIQLNFNLDQNPGW